MILFLPFVLLLSSHLDWDLTRTLGSPSTVLQNKCIEWFAHPTDPDDLSASFICGQRVARATHKNLLQKSGIYHAIVVSGGHFIFLEAVMKQATIPLLPRLLVLLLYYLTTGLQAPGLRCLMQMGLGLLVQRFNWKTSRSSLCFYSGLLCLAISSPLWNSLSFWLSFSVSMGLCFTQDFLTRKNKHTQMFLSLVFIYLFLLPFNYTSGYLHPMNLILGALLLFPFCVVLTTCAMLVGLARLSGLEFLYSLTTPINSSLFWVLQRWTLIIPDKNKGTLSLLSFWIYVFILVSSLHIAGLYFRRETIRE